MYNNTWKNTKRWGWETLTLSFYASYIFERMTKFVKLNLPLSMLKGFLPAFPLIVKLKIIRMSQSTRQ